MTKLYKLTDAQGRTRAGEDNELTWAVGVEHKTTGTGTRLCSSDVIHAYEHPLIAVLMNPVHAMLNPWQVCLFLAEGKIVARDNFHCGVHSLKIVKELPVPKFSLEMQVQLAIWAAKHTCTDTSWNQWADAWLNQQDRSEVSAKRAGLVLENRQISATFAAEAACHFSHTCGSQEPDRWGVSTAFFTNQAVAEALLQSGFNTAQIADVAEAALLHYPN